MAASLTDQLKSEFSSKSVMATRLHRIMAYHEFENDPKKLEEAVGLAVNLGRVSLQTESGTGHWKPLDVAVITGYQLGVEFLLKQGVGPTPAAIAFARMYHPEFLPLLGVRAPISSSPSGIVPLSPHVVTSERAKVFAEALPIAIEVPQGPFVYEAPNDFGVMIKKLLLTRDPTERELVESKGTHVARDVRTTHLSENMKELAGRLGFELVFSAWCYYPRDHFLPSTTASKPFIGGATGYSDSGARDSQIAAALEKGNSWMVHKQQSAPCFTSHFSFAGVIGSTLHTAPQAIDDYRELYQVDRPEGRLYVEGGNMYTVGVGGERVIFLGMSHLPINLALGHSTGFIKEASVAGAPRPKTFTNAQIFDLVEDRYALGFAKVAGKMGVLSQRAIGECHQDLVKRGSKVRLKEALIEKGTLTPLPFTAERNLQQYAKHVSEFAYEKNLLGQIFKATFGAKVHFLPEVGYHLDNFMRPGPKGTMLVQSYGMAELFLDAIARNSALFGLTARDEEILARYQSTTYQLQAELGSILRGVAKELEVAGVTVLPIPALFYDASLELIREPTFHVNFINGISGYSRKTKSFYYVTTGAQVGDHLGQALMDVFTWYMQQLEPKLEVYFVGRNPRDPQDFSESMRYWNRPGDIASNSGLHCLTTELEIAPVKRN